MPLDDLALIFQRCIDRLIRLLRLGPPPAPRDRRLLIVQIDGLPASVLEQALADGRMPFLRRLLHAGRFRVQPMSVGLPSSTPTFQMAAMYGVRPDIPGFHYHDKRRRSDVYFPRGGDAAVVERAQAVGRAGILAGGSAYGCVFTGGAANNLFSFTMIKRPSGRGLLRAGSAFVVLGWVVGKGLLLSSIEMVRALMRLIADPVQETTRGWRWLVLRLVISVWIREFFTLVVARDLYAGVPAVYVNYLDYDVFAHSYGPRHRRALRALRRIDRSIHDLWRVLRRVPEHQYDLYVLSDHGQTDCVSYQSLTGGRSLERVLLDDFFDQARAAETPALPRGRRIAARIDAFRTHRAPGLFQRFLNYLPRDFLSALVETPEARQRHGVRVVTAGPNAFVYFLDVEQPLTIEEIAKRFPGSPEDISRSRGVGFLLARSADGPVCVWRGKRYRMGELGAGPFAGRADVDLVAEGIQDLMQMPSAGDLVLYGNGTADGDVSFIPELGAHAGPAADELHAFVMHPAGVKLPDPLRHPIQLYGHFIRYQQQEKPAAA
jgi:hypothetical protein